MQTKGAGLAVCDSGGEVHTFPNAQSISFGSCSPFVSVYTGRDGQGELLATFALPRWVKGNLE
jgi:hypothetical protein